MKSALTIKKSVIDYFDTEHAIRRINLDIPEWAIEALDEEASRRGIPRQALVKNWIIDRLDAIAKERKGAPAPS